MLLTLHGGARGRHRRGGDVGIGFRRHRGGSFAGDRGRSVGVLRRIGRRMVRRRLRFGGDGDGGPSLGERGRGDVVWLELGIGGVLVGAVRLLRRSRRGRSRWRVGFVAFLLLLLTHLVNPVLSFQIQKS